MIVTTTPSVEGRKIVEYRGIVFGEALPGSMSLKDTPPACTTFWRGRAGAYEGRAGRGQASGTGGNVEAGCRYRYQRHCRRGS